MSDRLEFYKDRAGAWRWKVIAGNGRIIDGSTEGFSRKWNARRNYKRTHRG